MRQHILEQTPSAWKANFALAQSLVHYVQPKIIVDLGVDYGYSSYALAEQGIGTVYAVDWFKGDQHAGFKNTYNYVIQQVIAGQYNNIKIVSGDFADIAEQWTLPVDILHIDGEHTYEAVSKNYADWHTHVVERGVVLLHDTISFPNTVGRFFDNLDLPKINFAVDNGLGIVAKHADIINDIKAMM